MDSHRLVRFHALRVDSPQDLSHGETTLEVLHFGPYHAGPRLRQENPAIAATLHTPVSNGELVGTSIMDGVLLGRCLRAWHLWLWLFIETLLDGGRDIATRALHWLLTHIGHLGRWEKFLVLHLQLRYFLLEVLLLLDLPLEFLLLMCQSLVFSVV